MSSGYVPELAMTPDLDADDTQLRFSYNRLILILLRGGQPDFLHHLDCVSKIFLTASP